MCLCGCRRTNPFGFWVGTPFHMSVISQISANTWRHAAGRWRPSSWALYPPTTRCICTTRSPEASFGGAPPYAHLSPVRCEWLIYLWHRSFETFGVFQLTPPPKLFCSRHCCAHCGAVFYAPLPTPVKLPQPTRPSLDPPWVTAGPHTIPKRHVMPGAGVLPAYRAHSDDDSLFLIWCRRLGI